MKKFLFTIITLVGLLLLPTSVLASTASVKVSASTSKINLGGTVTATVTITGSVPIGSWQYSLVYDTSKLTLTSSSNSTYIVDYASSSSTYKKSYSYTFKGTALGSANISIKNASVVDFASVSDMSVTTSGCTVNVANFSSNANLKSLSITGGDLNPAFSADTTTYNVSLPNTINSVTISASVADSSANVGGVGTFSVVEGSNTFNVTVTAENGTVKTYTLNVDVTEKNPITVKIDKQSYTVVRNAGKVQTPVGYTTSTVKINDNDIASFKSDITKLTLVVLKDDKGNFVLATYNEAKKTYALYNQVTASGTIVYLMQIDNKKVIPSNYKATTVTINNIKVTAYKIHSYSRFALVYGMNVENGKTNVYMYDNQENTLQVYNTEEIDTLNKTINNYFTYIIIAGSTAVIFLILSIVFIIASVRKGKGPKPYKGKKLATDEYLERTMELGKEIAKEKNKQK